MVVERLALVASAPKCCPKGVVVDLKSEIVEGKGGRKWLASHQSLADWPCLASTQSLFSSSTPSCSYHAHSIDQKHQNKANFFHPFSKFFLLFFKNRFYIMQ
jgi:hypothetical protein